MRSQRTAQAVIAGTILVSCGCIAAEHKYDTIPLKEKQLQPFSIQLPDWQAEREVNLGDNGKIRLLDPRAGGKFVSILWNPGDGFEESMRIAAPTMANIGLHQLSNMAVRVSGKDVTVLRYGNKEDTKHFAMSSWYCKESDTTVMISSYIDPDWDEVLKLHERLLMTVRCHATDKMKLPGPSGPKFVAVNGYMKDEEAKAGIIFRNRVGSRIFYTNALPSNAALKQPGLQSKFFEDSLKAVFDLRSINNKNKPVRRGDKDIWIGLAETAKGNKVIVMSTWWECSNPAVAFFGGYVGYVDPIKSGDIDILASAKCP